MCDTITQITINRPHKRNAFRPRTVAELSLCFADARDDPDIGVVILTGPTPCCVRAAVAEDLIQEVVHGYRAAWLTML